MTDITVSLPDTDDTDTSGSFWHINGDTVLTVGVAELNARWGHVELVLGEDSPEPEMQIPVDEAERVFLAGLAAVREARYRQRAAEIGCDFTPDCPAGDTHMRDCLGAYRTAGEVEAGVVPDADVLERRHADQAFHDAYMRAGGGS